MKKNGNSVKKPYLYYLYEKSTAPCRPVAAIGCPGRPEIFPAGEQRHVHPLGAGRKTFPVATGENAGRKRKAGDAKTPEGTFTVTWIQNTRGVLYDYHDGHGQVEAYGPWFIHLETGFKAIGIHGTCPHRDDRIGTRDSKGCIRLHNADLLEILPYIEKGTRVVIIPGPEDALVDRDL